MSAGVVGLSRPRIQSRHRFRSSGDARWSPAGDESLAALIDFPTFEGGVWDATSERSALLQEVALTDSLSCVAWVDPQEIYNLLGLSVHPSLSIRE